MELARVKRELAEVRIEREILKSDCVLCGESRCQVRVHKSNAIHAFDRRDMRYLDPEQRREHESYTHLLLV